MKIITQMASKLAENVKNNRIDNTKMLGNLKHPTK